MKLGEWLGLVCLIAALYVLWQIRQILLLIFTAVVVAIALNSLARQLQRLGLKRRMAIPIVVTGSLLLITLFFVGIVPPFAEQFTVLIELVLSGIQSIPDRLTILEEQLPGQLRLPNLEEFLDWLTSPDSAVLDVFNNFFSFFNSSLKVLLQVLLVLILSLMFLGNPSAYRSGTLRLFPSFYRRRADGILEQCEVALCNWLAGILLNSLFVFALSFVGLSLLGIRLVFAHALLAGLLNFIPNIGPTLSLVFPAMVALISPEPWKVFAVVVLYVIIQQVESYWLTPTVMAHQVSLLPAFTLIAQIFFATMFGFLGLVLALPLAVVAKTWLQELVIKDILDSWQTGPHWLKPSLVGLSASALASEAKREELAEDS
ncbi:MAG: AI-2E family transporter [Leptolyngbya sp. SIO4C1]|nr:AI-2E family transporter [Leptolyngbya sp. SIO4C1]